MAVAAAVGAVGLVTGSLDVGPAATRLPADSPVLAGVALAVAVAAPMALAAVRLRSGDPRGPGTAVAAGLLLMSWILAQAAILQELSWLQPVCFLYGLAVALRGAGAHARATPTER
ncbi:MAG: hypothetical protein JWL64_2318 [Frankiales bacterium]|nr:hypothetical protein [Frankiales bacterium]